MSKLICIINGSGGTGKDTFVEYCGKFVWVENISTVDKVKVAGGILGWDGGKTEADRAFLSDLKLLADKYYNHSSNYILENVYDFIKYPYKNVMFVQCREPENIVRLKELLISENFIVQTVLIKNPNVDPIISNMADANVDNYKYDHVIFNDGTLEDLFWKAETFIKYLSSQELHMV